MALKFIKRLSRHLFICPNAVKCHFPEESMRRIEAAIASTESTHLGEIRFAVESHLHVFDIFRKKSGKRRALEVFSQLHIWDTAHNNGVLIYLLLADRDFEILADRGIHQHVGGAGWEKICQQMEVMFRQGQFEAGVLHGIDKIGVVLEKHFPRKKSKKNELSNKPLIL